MVYNRIGIAAVTFLLFLTTAGAASGAPQAKPKGKKADQTLTGCLDERAGAQYVLVEERTIKHLADLKAESFANEGFAKHLGHKVTVHGTISSSNGRPEMSVRKIEMISEICTRQP